MRLVLSVLLSLVMSSVLSSAALQLGRRFTQSSYHAQISSQVSSQVSSISRLMQPTMWTRAPQASLVSRFGWRSALKNPVEKPSPIVFAEATKDKAFKRMLVEHKDADDVRLQFLQSLVPNLELESVELASSAYFRHFVEYDRVGIFLKSKNTLDILNGFSDSSPEQLKIVQDGTQKESKVASSFRSDFVENFDSLASAFAVPFRRGFVDFICTPKASHSGIHPGHIFVEVQVLPQDRWDQRALYYAALVYSSQLKRVEKGVEDDKPWHKLKHVLSINLLGGQERDSKYTWPRRSELLRHYKFVDIHKLGVALDKGCKLKRVMLEGNSIPIGIEIMQYTLANIPEEKPEDMSELQFCWFDLLRNSVYKTEEDVEKLSLMLPEDSRETFLKAWEFIRWENFSKADKLAYTREDLERGSYTEKFAEARAEGEARERTKAHQAKLESARGFLVAGTSPELVANSLKLPLDEIMRIVETQS